MAVASRIILETCELQCAGRLQSYSPRRHQGAVKPSGGGRPGALVVLISPTTGRRGSALVRHRLSRPVPCRVPFPFEATTAGCSSCCHPLLLLLRAHRRVFGALQHIWQLLVEGRKIERVNDRKFAGEHLRDGRLVDDGIPISCRCGLFRTPSCLQYRHTFIGRLSLCQDFSYEKEVQACLVGITNRERFRKPTPKCPHFFFGCFGRVYGLETFAENCGSY